MDRLNYVPRDGYNMVQLSSALPETIMEVENHRFVEENRIPRGRIPLACLLDGG